MIITAYTVLIDRMFWVMPYEPRNPHHLRYIKDGAPIEPAKHQMLVDDALKINRALGYDFNTVELALRDGIPYLLISATRLPMLN